MTTLLLLAIPHHNIHHRRAHLSTLLPLPLDSKSPRRGQRPFLVLYLQHLPSALHVGTRSKCWLERGPQVGRGPAPSSGLVLPRHNPAIFSPQVHHLRVWMLTSRKDHTEGSHHPRTTTVGKRPIRVNPLERGIQSSEEINNYNKYVSWKINLKV